MENLDNYETLLDELFEDYRRAQAEKAANGAGSSQGGRISDIGRLDELAAELKEIEDMAKDDACETEDTLARAGRSVEAEFIEKTRRSNKLPAKPGDANYYDHLHTGFGTPEPGAKGACKSGCSHPKGNQHRGPPPGYPSIRKPVPKATSKAEKNEKLIDIRKIQGFRGADNLEDLLKFINEEPAKEKTAEKKKKKQPAKKNKKKSA